MLEVPPPVSDISFGRGTDGHNWHTALLGYCPSSLKKFNTNEVRSFGICENHQDYTSEGYMIADT